MGTVTMRIVLLALSVLLKVAAVLGTECGETPIRPNLNGFIVGGVEARANSIPWQIGLGVMNGGSYGGQICGGSIVSKNIIVTAAHCIKSYYTYYVKVGQHKRTSYESQGGKYIKFIKVAEAITHPRWNPSSIAKYDIAILRLAEDIDFNDGVQPICLPSPTQRWGESTNYLVTGWGTTTEGGYSSKVLMQVVVPYITQKTCKAKLGNSNVHCAVICAGYAEGGKDSCQGDSGGPLAAKINGKWTLAGVVSWGYGCARRNQPGVYTNVVKYRDFIDQYL